MRRFAFFLLALSACGEGGAAPPAGARVVGERGIWPGDFVTPRGVAADSMGRFYVVDKSVLEGAGRIQSFDAAGNHLRTIPLPVVSKGFPTNLGVRRNGNLLVPDTHNNRVLEYTPEGKKVLQFGRLGTGPGEFTFVTDAAEGPDGALFVCDYGGLDEEGRIIERVQKFDARGGFLLAFGKSGTGPGEFQRPMGLAISREGVLFVADSVNHRIQRFDLSGKFLGEFGRFGSAVGELMHPYDLALDAGGAVHVLEYGNQRIQKFSPEGAPLGIFGGPGSEPGQFLRPRGIAFRPDGTLVVADTENHRVQILRAAWVRPFQSPSD